MLQRSPGGCFMSTIGSYVMLLLPLVLFTFRLNSLVQASFLPSLQSDEEASGDGSEWDDVEDKRREEVVEYQHNLAWRIAGVFAVVATILSFIQIRLHILWYVLSVSIFCVSSSLFLSLLPSLPPSLSLARFSRHVPFSQ